MFGFRFSLVIWICGELGVFFLICLFLHGVILLDFGLQRFEGILGGKIDKAVAFEEVLVLSSFMCKASQVCLVFVLYSLL